MTTTLNYFISFIRNLFSYIKLLFKIYANAFFSQPIAPPPTPNQTKQYLLDKTAYFNERKNDTSYPQQIEPFFYDKTQYANTMKDITNPYEKQWKTRILFEHTPRGNIIMLYDIYKMGFCYYSDQQSIPYDILNAAAMKYVVVFKCLDFFIDETYYKSPFLELYEMENVKENKTQTRIQKQNTNIKNTLQIAKKTTTIQSTTLPVPETIKNRFLYQGKMTNFSFCQKISKKVAAARTKHAYSDLFESDVKHISYKDFKTKIVQRQTETSQEQTTSFFSPPYLSSKL
jgi:hypothetical protein